MTIVKIIQKQSIWFFNLYSWRRIYVFTIRHEHINAPSRSPFLSANVLYYIKKRVSVCVCACSHKCVKRNPATHIFRCEIRKQFISVLANLAIIIYSLMVNLKKKKKKQHRNTLASWKHSIPACVCVCYQPVLWVCVSTGTHLFRLMLVRFSLPWIHACLPVCICTICGEACEEKAQCGHSQICRWGRKGWWDLIAVKKYPESHYGDYHSDPTLCSF